VSLLNVESRQEAFAFTMTTKAKARRIDLRTAMMKKARRSLVQELFVFLARRDRLEEVSLQEKQLSKEEDGGKETTERNLSAKSSYDSHSRWAKAVTG
jgi:hypothetical protein